MLCSAHSRSLKLLNSTTGVIVDVYHNMHFLSWSINYFCFCAQRKKERKSFEQGNSFCLAQQVVLKLCCICFLLDSCIYICVYILPTPKNTITLFRIIFFCPISTAPKGKGDHAQDAHIRDTVTD